MIFAMSKWMNVGPADEKRADSTFFGLSLPFRRSASPASPEQQRLTLSQIKLKMELSFQDVEGMPADRLRLKVRCAREVKELWQLRSDSINCWPAIPTSRPPRNASTICSPALKAGSPHVSGCASRRKASAHKKTA